MFGYDQGDDVLIDLCIEGLLDSIQVEIVDRLFLGQLLLFEEWGNSVIKYSLV